jgi:hypothetical protein
MRRPAYFLLPVLCLACLLSVIFSAPQLRSQSGSQPENVAQFRIVVGLTDTAAKPWQGEITVSGAALDSLAGWRFSQADRTEPTGKFEFRTKVAALENQLLPGQKFGQTDWADARMQRLVPEGLILRTRGADGGRIKFESASGAFEFAASAVPLGRSITVLGGNGSVERLPVEEKLSEPGVADDYPALAVTPEGARWVAWLAYEKSADRVMVRGGGRTYDITGPGDHHGPALAADGKGKIWAAWSRNENGTFQLYARAFDGKDWLQPEKLTSRDDSNIWPRLASDGKGKLALVWQGFRDNRAAILGRLWDGSKWSAETILSEGTGNCWAPAAAFGGGKLWVTWDSYATGAYQIYARPWSGPVQRITRGGNFSVRPSVVVSGQGTPVVAWEESDALWGKDFTFLFDRRGTPLYTTRRIRVATQQGADWKELASVAESMQPGLRRYLQQPQLAMDESGRLYMALRSRTSAGTARIDYWANNGRWEAFLTHLDGDRWSPAVPMPSSVGRNGMIAALSMQGGKAHMVWAADNRAWPAVKYTDLDIYAASIEVEGAPARLSGGKTIVADAAPAGVNPNPNESADTKRIRDYRIAAGEKHYRILRGDLHRHTELSNDGAGDGSLDDLYRYFLDAAQMDYAHVGDHQMGNDEEYNWWLTQKSNDLYNMPRRFVPLYGYERSVWYPNGHRNVIWAERGKPVLRIGQPEAKGTASSGPILYPYLRETKGIATPHSTATEQGTDWRDNDPALEPLVEIYQGFESNYEHAGAPRAWKEGESKVHQGVRPDGYVWNAWAKGYKLGVQSSSDHISTHSSYACILVEDFTRQGLVDAMRKRHAYAATDQIVLDYRMETADNPPALMGDIITTSSRPKLLLKVIGTAPIKQIDVIKNNMYIHKVNPNQKEAALEYVDNSAAAGESYYYVRVEQTDGQLAWSSPIWTRRK